MPARAGSGRKPTKIDLVELEKLAALQCTIEEIAAWFGVSDRTIYTHFKKPELAKVVSRGKAKGRVSLRRNLMASTQPGPMIFLAKNLLGMRDDQGVHLTGKDGGPVELKHDITPTISAYLATVRAWRSGATIEPGSLVSGDGK